MCKLKVKNFVPLFLMCMMLSSTLPVLSVSAGNASTKVVLEISKENEKPAGSEKNASKDTVMTKKKKAARTGDYSKQALYEILAAGSFVSAAWILVNKSNRKNSRER